MSAPVLSYINWQMLFLVIMMIQNKQQTGGSYAPHPNSLNSMRSNPELNLGKVDKSQEDIHFWTLLAEQSPMVIDKASQSEPRVKIAEHSQVSKRHVLGNDFSLRRKCPTAVLPTRGGFL